MKKKGLSIFMIAALTAAALSGCGNQAVQKETAQDTKKPAGDAAAVSDAEENSNDAESVKELAGQTITVWSERTGDDVEELEKICEAFEEETGIIVDFSAPGTDYENLLRMKMASNEMPDIWSTHGWAVKRYAEVLTDLSGEPWVSRTIPSILSQVTDEKGRVLSMCIDSATAGIGYNAGVFEEYGLELPETVDELYDVCDQILEKSGGKVTPIHIGGGDAWPIAQMMDYLSTTLLVSDSGHDESKSLADGSFDWEKYRPMAEFFKTIKERGYVNVDCLTATNDDSAKALASGMAAITPSANRVSILNYNPEAKTGFFAVPVFYEGDEPVVIGGESDAFGIWKDTPHMEACKAFLNYLARPDVNQAFCESVNIRSSFTDVTADLGDMQVYYDNIASLRVMPYFDRACFPSGMWDAMNKYGQLLFTEDYSADDFLKDMSGDYTRLMSQ